MSGMASAAQMHASNRHERKTSQSTARSRRDRDGNERYEQRRYAYQAGNTDYNEGDILAPLQAQPRRPRQRLDSLSSVGSSVAPAGPSGAYGRSHAARHEYSNHHDHSGSQRQVSSRSIPDSPREEGGLEAWLRSQADAGPPLTGVHSNRHDMDRRELNHRTPSQQEARFRALDALSEGTKMTSTKQGVDSRGWQSTGGRGAGKRQPGSASWDTAGIPEDVEGISGMPSVSGMSGQRRAPSTQGAARGFLSWLEDADVDGQVGSEHRRRRREGGPQASGIMSASGVRVREGVRRSSNRSRSPGAANGAVPSIDALLSRSSITPSTPGLGGTGLSSSQSMGAASFRQHISGLPKQDPHAGNTIQQSEGRSLRSLQRDAQHCSPLRTWARYMLEAKSTGAINDIRSTNSSWTATICCIIAASALVKWCTGLGGWSGKGTTPMHGDLEAQRHWMEITLHLPMREWYLYDLQYWGLDYPPLTAFVSLWCGKIAEMFPSLRTHLALDSSRGSEDSGLIMFLRSTVLALDLLVYTPAALAFLHRRLKGRGRRTRAIAASTVLLQPALILIDHAHFQYNGVMLGLSAAAFALLYTSLPNSEVSGTPHVTVKSLSRRISFEYIGAAIPFSWSLCFKQMALYYAPAVFAIMLGRCYGLAQAGFERGLICFIGLGLATSITFGVFFAPWLTSVTQIAQVIHRIFPLARGLFEDKVSNVWCFFSVLPLPAQYKLRNAVDVTSLARLSLLVTLVSIALPCVHLFTAAAETVHIEMHLNEDSKRQVEASERRKAEGSLAGSTTTSRARTRPAAKAATQIDAFSEAAFSDMASGVLDGSQSLSKEPIRSYETQQSRRMLASKRPVASTSPSPAASVLPYALLSTSLAFFLFGFQTHEKSILLPLLPMTLLMSVKADDWGGGAGSTDWEWAVLMNNVAMFSMWPLLQRDRVILQYIVVTLGWNWAIGYQPFANLRHARQSFVAYLSGLVHAAMLSLHALEHFLPVVSPSLAVRVLARYPDIFPVLNVLLSTPVLGIIWLWALKRQLEVGFANGIDVLGMTKSSKASVLRRSPANHVAPERKGV